MWVFQYMLLYRRYAGNSLRDLASPACSNLLREHPGNAKGAFAVVVDVCLLHAVEIEQVPID